MKMFAQIRNLFNEFLMSTHLVESVSLLLTLCSTIWIFLVSKFRRRSRECKCNTLYAHQYQHCESAFFLFLNWELLLWLNLRTWGTWKYSWQCSSRPRQLNTLTAPSEYICWMPKRLNPPKEKHISFSFVLLNTALVEMHLRKLSRSNR